MSDTEPIRFRVLHEQSGIGPQGHAGAGSTPRGPSVVAFNRQELNEILALYGRKVAAGEWAKAVGLEAGARLG